MNPTEREAWIKEWIPLLREWLLRVTAGTSADNRYEFLIEARKLVQGLLEELAEDWMAPYAEFRAAVKKWVQARNDNRLRMAAHFEVSQTAVDRWWLGTATPHPLLQEQILKWIKEQR